MDNTDFSTTTTEYLFIFDQRLYYNFNFASEDFTRNEREPVNFMTFFHINTNELCPTFGGFNYYIKQDKHSMLT